MSFSSQIKDELCRVQSTSPCCALSESLGFLLYASKLSAVSIKLHSELPFVRKRANAIIRQAFGVQMQSTENSNIIEDIADIKLIYDMCGYDYPSGVLHLNRAIVEDECCKTAFMRGAFLAGGTVSAPEKGYHLELVTPRYRISKQVSTLLLDMDMPAATVMRRGNYVIYYKDSQMIEDFLTRIGASGAAMKLMLTKVERELRNEVNRKVNCDTANLNKTVDAASAQIMAIAAIKAAGKFETLPSALQITATLREENPELSLRELCELFTPPISRPGLAARLRKLTEIGEKCKNE